MAKGKRRSEAAAKKAQRKSAAYLAGGGVTPYARRWAGRARRLGTYQHQGRTMAYPLPFDPEWTTDGRGPGRTQRHVGELLPHESTERALRFRHMRAPEAPPEPRPFLQRYQQAGRA